MENMEEKKTNVRPSTVHDVLAHSYSIYLVALAVGVILDVFFKFRPFSENARLPGLVIIAAASGLIVWAQNSSRALRRARQNKERLETRDFCRGPYCVSRSPTHWGLVLLVVGFSLVINSAFVLAAGILAFILTRSVFLSEEEKMLAQKYGEEYLRYKKQVRL